MSIKGVIKGMLPANIADRIAVIYRNMSVISPAKWFTADFGKVRLNLLVVSVGQACNFRCRDCSNFAPRSPERFKRYNVNDIKNDLLVLFENIEYIELLQIQGGEPFLYSDLTDLINFLHEHKSKVNEIVIATNGSIIPNDIVLRSLKENDVLVRVSDYGIAQERCKALMEKLESDNIRSYLYCFGSNQSLWYDCGNENKCEQNRKVVRNRYYSCVFRNCLTLERGELSYCSRATNSYVIQGFKRADNDYFNLREYSGGGYKRRLAKYLVYRHPMRACCYCNGTNNDKLIPPAIQMGQRES